jgi:hypothetical protein
MYCENQHYSEIYKNKHLMSEWIWSKVRPVSTADNHTTICEPIV